MMIIIISGEREREREGRESQQGSGTDPLSIEKHKRGPKDAQAKRN